MITGMGSVFRVVQVGSGSASGIITDDSETFGLVNWKSEVDGVTCGTADKGGEI